MEFLERTLIALCLLNTTPAAAHLYTPKYKQLIAMDRLTVCAQDDEGLHCYDNPFYSSRPSVNEEMVDGLALWGSELRRLRGNTLTYGMVGMGLRHEYKFKNPRSFSGNCLLDDDGVHCWRVSYRYALEWLPVPPLSKPRQVFSGNRQTCVFHDYGLKCWSPYYGTPNYHERNDDIPNGIIWPQSVDINYLTCAIDGLKLDASNTLKCWDNWDVRQFDIVNPQQVSVGLSDLCAVGPQGVKCWSYTKEPLFAPALKNPVAVAIGGSDSACAIDDDGLVCWNTRISKRFMGGYEQVPDTGYKVVRMQFKAVKPTVANPRFNLDQIDSFLEVTSKAATPTRAKFFGELNRFTKDRLMENSKNFGLNLGRYLVAKLSASAIATMNSKYSGETLMPIYIESLRQIEHELKFINMHMGQKVEATDISQVPKTSLTIEVALRTIVAAVTVAKEFAQEAQKPELASLLRPLGQALAAPNAANVAEAVAQLDARKPTLETLATNSKSAFLVDTINLAQEWLRR